MKKSFYIFLFALALIPNSSFSLRIGIIGDQTGTTDIDHSYEIMSEGCAVMSTMKPDIVIHIGDIVESSLPDTEITNYFNKGTAYLDNIQNKHEKQTPWYLCAGDHDVNPTEWTPGSTDYSKENLFRSLLQNKYNSLYGSQAPELGDNLYYSFDFDGYHFIILFSEETLRVDPRWGNIFMAKISDAQYSWLENDLKKSQSSKGTIVFVHQPLWYNWTCWMKVHQLLKNFNVMAVVAGHFHYNQTEGEIDGIEYLVVSATGGIIKDGSENSGSLWAVTTLDISDSNSINPSQIPVSGTEPVIFTSRENMDRVEALSSMLSSLERSDSSAAGDMMGNPIDLPLDIYISYSTDGNAQDWLLYKTYQPGYGVILSNLSSVELYNNSIPTSIKGVKLIFKDAVKETFSIEQIWTDQVTNNKSSLTQHKLKL